MEPHPPPIPASTGSSSSLGADNMARAASDEWKSARTRLTDAVGSYLTACSSLRTTCATALYQSPRNATVEEILANVAYELGYLASEEIKLRGVRVSLTEMRNMSMALAPINMLPDEILAHVLDLSTPCCARDSEKRIVFHDLAAVCKRWRRVTMNATNLWAHIDVGPDTPVGLSMLLLERTRDSPICIHVYEPEYHDPRELEYDEPCKSTPADQINKVLEVLKPHMHRVYTLDINSPHSDTDLTAFVLNLWLCCSSPGLTRSLLIYCPEASYPVLDSEDNTTVMRLTVPDNADDTLRSLSTIHLSGVMFGWNSSVYHGLVDLRIGNSAISFNNVISTSQFAEILSASPALAVLKLRYLTIRQPEGWTQPAPIPMNHLSVLNLGTMEPDNGLDMLFPLIGLSQSLPHISVSVVFHNKEQNGFHTFLARSKITTLCCKYWYPPEPFQLPPRHLIRNLHTLILPRIDIVEASSTKGNLSLFQPPPFHPLGVILLDCTVSFEGLKEFISGNDIQQLCLDRCVTSVKDSGDAWHWEAESRKTRKDKLHRIRDQLMETYPLLRCSVSETDSTSQWPCRTMSDTERYYDKFQ